MLVPILRLLTILYFSVLSLTHAAATAPAASSYSPPTADHADAFATRPGEARIHQNDSEQLEKRATYVRNGALPFSLPLSLLLSWLCPFSLVCPEGRDRSGDHP
jgi:hypothetical protein